MVLRPAWSAAARARVPGQALDHRGGAEQGHALVSVEQLEHLRRIEAAARRHDLAGALGGVRQDVEPRAVRHRRGVEDGVRGRDLVDVGEVAQRHGQQILVGEHRALGPARGAAGIEQPGDRVRPDLDERHRVARQQLAVVGRADLDHPQALEAGLERADRVDQVRGGEGEPGAGVAQDVGELARVQPGVDRQHGETGIPAGEQQLDVVAAVGHHQRDPIAGLQPVQRAQPPGHDRGAPRQLAIGHEHVATARHGRALGEPGAGPDEQMGDVHRDVPSLSWRPIGRVRI